MDTITSIYFNNSPYTIQSTGIIGSSTTIYFDQHFIDKFTKSISKQEQKELSCCDKKIKTAD